jgi:hypothetical protein
MTGMLDVTGSPRIPFLAVYMGGPADGREETIHPAPGEALDSRRVAIPYTPTLADYDPAGRSTAGPTIAVYECYEIEGYTIGPERAALLGVEPGHYVTQRRYRYQRTE